MGDPKTRLIVAVLVLVVALAFFIFGQGLLDLDTAEAPSDPPVTPTALLALLHKPA